MRRTELRGLAIAAALTIFPACVPALREPPALDALAARSGGRAPEPLAEAERLWNERTLASVNAAGALYQAAVDDADRRLEALLGAARTHLWLADHETDSRARLDAAVEAINFAQWCGRVAPGEPECDYRLALGIGLQVKERRATAIDGLSRMVELLQATADRAPGLDHAGAHRVLALVYLRAPGWPSGPGDADLGLEQAQQAVRLDPDYPPNRMALAEALRETGQPAAAREESLAALRLAETRVGEGDPDAAEWLAQAREDLALLEQR